MEAASRRMERRTSTQVKVDLASLNVRTPAEEGVTENVSPHGARIVTTRHWRPNERINVRSLWGTLRSRARVVYCQPRDERSFAIGVELIARTGEWATREGRQRAAAAAGRSMKPGRH
ncbi:MAG TPA: PilZ domain-containing protein [Methylomirabilota bacterium]|nr:PilZ domain-containing protein [Methylomirabilota bacterium]